MAIEATRQAGATLADLIDRILDKGLVINADIQVSVAGVELLGIKIRAALASFETAARWGLEFPSGTRLETAAWREARRGGEPFLPHGEGEAAEGWEERARPWLRGNGAGAGARGRFPPQGDDMP